MEFEFLQVPLQMSHSEPQQLKLAIDLLFQNPTVFPKILKYVYRRQSCFEGGKNEDFDYLNVSDLHICQ